MDDREQLIRDRAYAIWQREGRPEGREREHWQAAAREVEQELGPSGGSAAPGDAPAAGEAGKPMAEGRPGAAGTKRTAAAKAKPAASAKMPSAKEKPSAADKSKPSGRGARKTTDR